MSEQQNGRAVPAEVNIIIIGSGFGGLGVGARLKQSGHEDFVILERAQDVGGTWRDNCYPGVACDVPSHLYSFSFMPNAHWSRVFSPGREIQAYLQTCAREAGLLPHIHFGTEMLSARWDEERQQWVVETPHGTWRGRYLITAAGVLSEAHLPAIPGLESFTGALFHSARWDHDCDLAGKRIGVVGSGASAIQIIPELAKVARELVVFQRHAPYIIPRPDRAYSDAEKRMFARDPESMSALRSEIFWFWEAAYAQRRGVPRFLAEARELALGHLAAQVPDGSLRAKLTPDYEIGCKRILISNNYYPTFSQNNVTLEASALARIANSQAVATSGQGYELDVLVFATGFEVAEPPFATRVYGRTGGSLAARWSGGMQALDSITVSGFPNFFMINGPNTGLGHHSMVYIIESQVEYILGALAFARDTATAVLDPRREAEDAYVDQLHQRSQGTVWLDGGCKSWYLDPQSGRLTVLWPDFAYAFRDTNSTFHPAAYHAMAADTL